MIEFFREERLGDEFRRDYTVGGGFGTALKFGELIIMFRFGGTIKWCWLIVEGRFELSLKEVRKLLLIGNFFIKLCLG